MNGDASNRDLWSAINSLRETAGRLEVSVARIEARNDATVLPCPEHAEKMDALEKSVGTLRDRVTAGLTMKAVLVSVVAAAGAALLTGSLLWARVAAAVAAIQKGG